MQISELFTITENLREQLVSQTQANEQLKAELAAAHAESTRSIATHESRLNNVFEMLTAQRSVSSAQQGHLNSLDELVRLKTETFATKIGAMQDKFEALAAKVRHKDCCDSTTFAAKDSRWQDEGLAKALEASRDEQKAAAQGLNVITPEFKDHSAANTEELHEAQSVVTKKNSTAITPLNYEVTTPCTVADDVCQAHDLPVKEATSTAPALKAELATTTKALLKNQTRTAEKTALAIAGLRYALEEVEEKGDKQTAAAEEAKAKVSELEAVLSTLAVDFNGCSTSSKLKKMTTKLPCTR